MVGGIKNDCVREGGFPVYGGHPIGEGPVDCNVKVIYPVVGLRYCSEFHVDVDRYEVFTYAVDVCVVAVVNYQDDGNLAKVSCNLVLLHYVDDILIIYDPNHTDINSTRKDFNPIHPNMKFTAEKQNTYPQTFHHHIRQTNRQRHI